MKDNVRQELKELCYFIIENNNALSRPEQLTRVQMLYERLLVLNYLEEVQSDGEIKVPVAEKAIRASRVDSIVPSHSTDALSSEAQEELTSQEALPPKAQSKSDSPSLEQLKSSTVETTPLSSSSAEIRSEPRSEAEKAAEPAPLPNVLEPKNPFEEKIDINDGHQAPKSINDHLGKGPIQVGLNDRIAFVKHLFSDSQADFNRVLSQLNTLDTYLESMYFIENLVKPDYDWDDKLPYEERLINLVKKRFGEDW
jgi:hypothetical protein